MTNWKHLKFGAHRSEILRLLTRSHPRGSVTSPTNGVCLVSSELAGHQGFKWGNVGMSSDLNNLRRNCCDVDFLISNTNSYFERFVCLLQISLLIPFCLQYE
jgi:hypothetical protein